MLGDVGLWKAVQLSENIFLKMELTGCFETSVTIHQPTLANISGDWSYQLYHSRCMRSSWKKIFDCESGMALLLHGIVMSDFWRIRRWCYRQNVWMSRHMTGNWQLTVHWHGGGILILKLCSLIQAAVLRMKMCMTYQKENYRIIHDSTGEQIQRQLHIHLVIKIRILQTEWRMTVKGASKCKSKG